MKKQLVWIIILILLSSLDTRAEEEVKIYNGYKIGIGIQLNVVNVVVDDIGATVSSDNRIRFSVPIHINKEIKLEPEFGASMLFSSDKKGQHSDNIYWCCALGGYWKIVEMPKTNIYMGPKIGISRIYRDFEVEGKEKNLTSTNFQIGAGVGGEYKLSQLFSVGMELQLTYEKKELGVVREGTSTALYSNGVVFVRFYFK